MAFRFAKPLATQSRVKPRWSQDGKHTLTKNKTTQVTNNRNDCGADQCMHEHVNGEHCLSTVNAVCKWPFGKYRNTTKTWQFRRPYQCQPMQTNVCTMTLQCSIACPSYASQGKAIADNGTDWRRKCSNHPPAWRSPISMPDINHPYRPKSVPRYPAATLEDHGRTFGYVQSTSHVAQSRGRE